MDVKKHFFMTFVALFFLGLIVAKPGSAFRLSDFNRECRLSKGKMVCVEKQTPSRELEKVNYYYSKE
jgi:hypothetical protein